ncbi:hypothetical protein GQX74_015245 [Glossina fuscipes]|nr:hypothetical protein GQX74_015245 [Glossina fuscipes]
MNFSWLHDKPEAPPATWEDFAYFYRSKFYHFTVSDRDHVEKTQFYYNEALITENEGLNGCDFLPLNFKTAFSILTHQVVFAIHKNAAQVQGKEFVVFTVEKLYRTQLSKSALADKEVVALREISNTFQGFDESLTLSFRLIDVSFLKFTVHSAFYNRKMND